MTILEGIMTTICDDDHVNISPMGPIVSEDLVFVTETLDRKYEVVRALNRSTGEQVWSAQWEGSIKVPFFAKSNGDWIRLSSRFFDSSVPWERNLSFRVGSVDCVVDMVPVPLLVGFPIM